MFDDFGPDEEFLVFTLSEVLCIAEIIVKKDRN